MDPDCPTVAAEPQQTTCRLVAEVRLAAPFWQYQQMFAGEPYSFLLDSAKDPQRLGRHSFLGADPFLVYKATRRLRPGEPASAAIEIVRRHDAARQLLARPTVERREGDLFADLRRILHEARVEPDTESELPLLAGAVGYFGYEAGHFVENLPDQGADDLELPDVYLMFCDVLLAHCHESGRTWISAVGRGATDELARCRAQALQVALQSRLAAFERAGLADAWMGPDPARAADTTVDVHAHVDLASYSRLVETCQEHIFAGDVFEVCLTHRLDAPLAGSPWDLYQELRRINPAPFASYLQFPEAQIISSSPERYIRLSRQGIAESRPIKGTRRRGATPADDEAIYRELATSVKDRAENVMIVDLVRNDLGRVCKFGTVCVPELMAVEQYATVFQMVSTIQGELEDDRDALDLIRASFPGGSMTGAPKIEAMKIIDRLEPVKRGVYAGAIGYIDFAGTLDLAIAIRTFVARHGRCYFNVGGAIVADSIPRNEYHETLDKARALIAALTNLQASHSERDGASAL